ncbi:MAG: hypothetical protein PHX62_03570 [Bacilli bacterium]|nr:hypothetical protein [Bacilli bacterium]
MVSISKGQINLDSLFSKLNDYLSNEQIQKVNQLLLKVDNYLGGKKQNVKKEKLTNNEGMIIQTDSDENYIIVLLVFLIAYIVFRKK